MENAKIIITLATIFSIIAVPIAVFALTQIWSNEVTVTVSDHIFTVVKPADGSKYITYTFSGSLMLGANPVVGKTVALFIDDGGGYVTTGLSDTTASDGSYSIVWTPSVAGTFTFKVDAWV